MPAETNVLATSEQHRLIDDVPEWLAARKSAQVVEQDRKMQLGYIGRNPATCGVRITFFILHSAEIQKKSHSCLHVSAVIFGRRPIVSL